MRGGAALLTYMLGAAVMVVVYSQLTSAGALLIGGAVMGFFVNGMLGGYGALMSELYPTAIAGLALLYPIDIVALLALISERRGVDLA